MKKMMSKLFNGVRRSGVVSPARKRDAESGLAALELALLLPFLMALMFGAVGTFDLLRAHNQVTTASTTLADLTTRVLFMNDSQRDDFYAAATSLMGKFDGDSSFEMSITSVEADDPDESPVGSIYKVLWSEATDDNYTLDEAELEQMDLPPIDDTESIVVVVISASYHTPFANFGFPSEVNTTRVSVRRPRFVSRVLYQ